MLSHVNPAFFILFEIQLLLVSHIIFVSEYDFCLFGRVDKLGLVLVFLHLLCFFKLLDAFEVDREFRLLFFCQLLQLAVVEDCRDVQPEVERAWLAFKCNFEVTVDSLFEVMQLDDKEPLPCSWAVCLFNLVPRLGLPQLLFGEDVDMVLLPLLVLRHELDLVFVECGDEKVKLV